MWRLRFCSSPSSFSLKVSLMPPSGMIMRWTAHCLSVKLCIYEATFNFISLCKKEEYNGALCLVPSFHASRNHGWLAQTSCRGNIKAIRIRIYCTKLKRRSKISLKCSGGLWESKLILVMSTWWKGNRADHQLLLVMPIVIPFFCLNDLTRANTQNEKEKIKIFKY